MKFADYLFLKYSGLHFITYLEFIKSMVIFPVFVLTTSSTTFSVLILLLSCYALGEPVHN